MRRVLFVCLGNICRSPTAEGVARQMAAARGINVDIDSAGTGGWHAGDPPDARMTKAAAKRGIDLSSQRARQVQVDDFRTFDFIYAMDGQNLTDLEEIKPEDATANLALFLGNSDVPDPYYGGPDGFEHVLDLVEHRVDDLLEAWAR